MVSETLGMLITLGALGLGLGVFVSPASRLLIGCFFGVTIALAGLLHLAQAGLVSWAVLCIGSSIAAAAMVLPPSSSDESSTRGWRNWFAVVTVSSALWLLSMFLVWTFEEALAVPDELVGPISYSDILHRMFDSFLWAPILILLATLAVFRGMETEETQ